jgi:hypothetical protein
MKFLNIYTKNDSKDTLPSNLTVDDVYTSIKYTKYDAP